MTLIQQNELITLIIDGKPYEFEDDTQATAFLMSYKNSLCVKIDGLINKINKGE